MVPAKISSIYIQLAVTLKGTITKVLSGNFCKNAFSINTSIYTNASFLEGTLDALPENTPFILEGMLIVFNNNEFNVEVELLKEKEQVLVLIQNRTNTYKYIDELNQKRNDLFFTKRKIAENNKELENLRLKADKANEEKSRFLAIMSHEIRNPLNGILGNAELLNKEKLNEKAKLFSQNIIHSGKNLKVIVEDILDLSRIEAGKINLVEEEIDIKYIVDNCISNLEVINKKASVTIENQYNIKQSLNLRGDAVRIGQILSNLLSNALKFTTSGFVKLQTNLIKETKENATIVFIVEDSGRGMTQTQTKKIFEEYNQNNIDDNRILGGAGLGLAIVKKLIDAMNGKISVESILDFGTKFKVSLPLNKQINTKPNLHYKTEKITKDLLQNKRILLADDDLINQTIVKHLLNKEKVNLTVVGDGLTALQKLQTYSYDLVLLDIYMPNLTGNEVIAERAFFKKENQNIPLFALTANVQEKDVLQYIKAGFIDVIPKPFSQKQLSEKIYKALFNL